MRERLERVISRVKFAAIGGAIGAALGGLYSANAASSGAAIGALVGAVIGEKRVEMTSLVTGIKERRPELPELAPRN